MRFRLDVVRIRVPPLRERPDDVLVLAKRFWQAAHKSAASEARLHPDVLARLAQHNWPGNARELQNVLAALAIRVPVGVSCQWRSCRTRFKSCQLPCRR